MTFFHCQLKITWPHFIFYCVLLHYCTRIYLREKAFINKVVMVVWNDTVECCASQSYQIYLESTFTHVLAAGLIVTGLKDKCVAMVHCPSEITLVEENVSQQSRTRSLTTTTGSNTEGKLAFFFGPILEMLYSGPGTPLRLTRDPQTRNRPRRLAPPEFPSLVQNSLPVELTRA